MTADVIPIGVGYQLLRGPKRERGRQRQLSILRQAAYRRACALQLTDSDLALFGPLDQILIEGPGEDPRLTG